MILIISEILAITTLFYLSYLGYLLIFDFYLSIPFSHQQLLNPNVFRVSTNIGLLSISGEIFGGVISSLLFVFLEGKHRKALDFMSTTFIIHLLVVTFVCQFPTNLVWWVTTILSFIISSFFAGKISLNYELQEINLESIFPSALRN